MGSEGVAIPLQAYPDDPLSLFDTPATPIRRVPAEPIRIASRPHRVALVPIGLSLGKADATVAMNRLPAN